MLPSFEELMDLALNEPAKLEELRQTWVDETIDRAPESFQRRLRGLQFQIDMEREKASNPVSACVRISKMMHDGLANLQDVIKNSHSNEIQPQNCQKSIAAIIPFPVALPE
jgi:hypothetical protein